MKKKQAVHKCNICGYPVGREHREKNPETGEIEPKEIKCLGHTGIKPELWNGSSAYHTNASQAFLRSLVFEDYKKARISTNRRNKNG